MKKTTRILLFLNLLVSITCFAQTELLQTEVLQEKAQINLAKDILEVAPNTKQGSNAIVSISKMELVDKDLIIHLDQKLFKNGEYFMVNLAVKLNGEDLSIEPENLFGELNKNINFADEPQTYKIIWTNLMEEYIDLTGELMVSLSIDIYGNRDLPYNVDCGIEPTFTTKQKIPFLIAGILGAGSIAAGEYLKNESEKDYDTYLSQDNFESAEPFYQDANDKANTGRILTYAGIGVLTVDAIWFFVRQRRFRKQREVYNEFCTSKNISFQPQVELPLGSRDLSTSLSFTYRF